MPNREVAAFDEGHTELAREIHMLEVRFTEAAGCQQDQLRGGTDQRQAIDGLTLRNVAGQGNSTNTVVDIGSSQEMTIDVAKSVKTMFRRARAGRQRGWCVR